MKLFDLAKKFRAAWKMMTTPELLDQLLSSGYESEAGVTITPDTAMRVATVYACIKVLAETMAQLPLIVYREREDGGKDRLPNHPLYKVLHDQPMANITSYDWRAMMVGHTALRGNAYSYITRVGGVVRELIPIHPDRCDPEVQPDHSVLYKISGTSGIQIFNEKDILHLKGVTADGHIGISPIKQQRDTIGLARSYDEHGSKMFKNGAKPGGVLKIDGALSDKAYDRLKNTWSTSFNGDGVGNPAILEEGLDWKALALTAEDAQFIEQKKLSRSEIAAIFRVPPHKIGDLEKATFSNIEQQSIEFITDTILPWCKAIEQRFKLQLISDPKVHAEFLLTGLLRGDSKSRSEYYEKMVQNGLMSPNEARALENMNPYPGGEKFKPAENLYGNPDKKKEGNGNEDDPDTKE